MEQEWFVIDSYGWIELETCESLKKHYSL